MAPITIARNIAGTGVYTHTRDDSFFAKPSIINSYWAGFIAADGCIWSGTNTLAIKIHSKDKILLDRFKSDLQYTGLIGTIPSQNQSRIIVNSTPLVSDLLTNYNIGPAKSLTMTPPNLTNEDTIKSFIIGYIDGDGTICFLGKAKYLKLGIIGTRETLEWILEWFDKWTPPTKAKKSIQQKKTNKNICELTIYGKRAEALIKILKAVPVAKLDRKWDKI